MIIAMLHWPISLCCLLAYCSLPIFALNANLSAVMVTTPKDSLVFQLSLKSALIHLVDVARFYVICPDASRVKDLMLKSASTLNMSLSDIDSKVIFVDEKIFPFDGEKVVDTMIDAVKTKGQYPLKEGKSSFERTLWGKIGWFLQQLVKFYAGFVLHLDDFVILDSDLVWFKDIKFIADKQKSADSGKITYNYATSTQHHGAYIATMKRIVGVDPYSFKPFRSGVVHHIVISKPILQSMKEKAESLHTGLSFWQVLLHESAFEMTCRAPNPGVCGAGSTLSEYEMYLHFAQTHFPDTVNLRPLMWANGPMPGLLYNPDPSDPGPVLASDSFKYKWAKPPNSNSNQVLHKQMAADAAAGFHYVGYHNYAKRRYFELHKEDIDELCVDTARMPGREGNTTCAYVMLDESKEAVESWFKGCSCFMARHFAN